MAKCIIMMPDYFITKLSRLGVRTDEIIEKTLEAGASVVLPKVRSNLEAVIGSNPSIYTKTANRSTGELINSLGISPVSVNEKGVYNIKIGFNEPRRKQYDRKSPKSRDYYEITNAMIANVLEYGKSNQPARPFLKKAKAATRTASQKAMKEKFDSEVKNL